MTNTEVLETKQAILAEIKQREARCYFGGPFGLMERDQDVHLDAMENQRVLGELKRRLQTINLGLGLNPDDGLNQGV